MAHIYVIPMECKVNLSLRLIPWTWGPILVVILMAAGCGGGGGSAPTAAPVDVPLTVSFAKKVATVAEGAGSTGVELVLSKPMPTPVTVTVDVLDSSTTRLTAQATGADLVLSDRQVVFLPGQTSAVLPVQINGDAFAEDDESLQLRIVAPEGIPVSLNADHQLIVTDDDRLRLVSVTDFGAVADDALDDTAAIQQAVDSLHAGGGGVLVFPQGTYQVTEVRIREGISYVGRGAVLKRPPGQGRWVRTFTADYSSDKDSEPLIISRLSFDGNSSQQSAYRQYELEHAHLVFLSARSTTAGRLRAYVEDSRFADGVADGVSVYTNVVADIDNVLAEDCFRGGVVVTGGNTRVHVSRLTTRSVRDRTGLDVEIDGEGYNGAMQVDFTLEDSRIEDGDLDIAVQEFSTVTINRLYAEAPMRMWTPSSQVTVRDSVIKNEPVDDMVMGRLWFPGQTLFENVEFWAVEASNPLFASNMVAAGGFVEWSNPFYYTGDHPARKNQTVTYRNCTFKMSPSLIGRADVYAIAGRRNDAVANNRIVVENPHYAADFLMPVKRF